MQLSLVKIRQYLFYLFIFSLPWQTRWIIRDPLIRGEVWEYGRISLYGWDIILIILLILSWPGVRQEMRLFASNFKFLIFNFKSNTNVISAQAEIQKNNQTRFLDSGSGAGMTRKNFLIYLLLLFLSLITVFWSADKILAAVWCLRLLEAGILWCLIKSLKPKLEYIFISLAAAGTIQAWWAIWQFVNQSTLANKWLGVAVHPFTQAGTSVILTGADKWLRAYAGQTHPNVLGGLLVITLLATAWLYIKNVKIKNQNEKLWLVLYFIQLIGLFFSFSRGAWLALFVSLLIWWWQNRKAIITNDKWGDIFVYWLVVFFTLTLLYWPLVQVRILGGGRLEQQSIDERVVTVQQSTSLLKQNWWHGTGINNYTKALQNFEPGLKAYRYQPVHNIFLLVLTELGVIGLVLFLGLLLSVFLRKPRVLSHVFLATVIIISFFDHYWWTMPSMVMIFWLVIELGELEE